MLSSHEAGSEKRLVEGLVAAVPLLRAPLARSQQSQSAVFGAQIRLKVAVARQ